MITSPASEIWGTGSASPLAPLALPHVAIEPSVVADSLEGVCDVDLEALDVELPPGVRTRLNATGARRPTPGSWRIRPGCSTRTPSPGR